MSLCRHDFRPANWEWDDPVVGLPGGSHQESTHSRSAAFAWKVALPNIKLGFGSTRAAAAVVDSAPWDKLDAAAEAAVAGPVTFTR